MSRVDRQYLAEQQETLMMALTQRQSPPAGMDVAHVTRLAATLLSKRRRAVARGLPRLAEALGESFAPRFTAYARETPLAADDDDGRRFTDWLWRQPGNNDAVRWDLLSLRVGRGLPLRIAVLVERRRTLAIGVRLPVLGVRVFKIKVLKPTARRGVE
jgi:hypothetical protein